MGQYYLTVNPVKRQFLHPHKFGCGLKLGEFSGQAHGIMEGLALLLAAGNGRPSGENRSSKTPLLPPSSWRCLPRWKPIWASRRRRRCGS
jgi:hypothetical protein